MQILDGSMLREFIMQYLFIYELAQVLILSSSLILYLKKPYLHVWHIQLDFHCTKNVMFDEQIWHNHIQCTFSQLQEWDLWSFLDLICLSSLTALHDMLLNLQLDYYYIQGKIDIHPALIPSYQFHPLFFGLLPQEENQ